MTSQFPWFQCEREARALQMGTAAKRASAVRCAGYRPCRAPLVQHRLTSIAEPKSMFTQVYEQRSKKSIT